MREGSPPPKPIQLFDALSSDEFDEEPPDYAAQGVMDIVGTRGKWLAAFCVGLIVAALIIERFEDVLAGHVELSFFLPLIMGHGGNTGSQTVSSIIRALALRQVRWRQALSVVAKEAAAGGIMGGMIGLAILALSCVWSEVTPEVGLVVAIAMPVVSLWANGLAAFITLASNKLKLDPAMTSGPLVTTLVDTTGLIIYFLIAKMVLNGSLSLAAANAAVASITAAASHNALASALAAFFSHSQ